MKRPICNWTGSNFQSDETKFSIGRDRTFNYTVMHLPLLGSRMTEEFPRYLSQRLEEAVAESPVSLIHGPRQCGKTTLAKQVGANLGFSYLSFDEPSLRQSAELDPEGFVADLPPRVILDEVQRVPGLFTSLKSIVDADRVAGRFILTGSAHILTLPRLADSLAGRMEILRLHPLSHSEIASTPWSFFERVFGSEFTTQDQGERLGRGLAERVVTGGYPVPVNRKLPRRRAVWYRDYAETLLQRDLRELSRIQRLDAVPRLLALAASQSSRLLNVSDLAAPFQVSRPTIREYLTLLNQVFLLDELPPWHSNRLTRMVKTPKLHIGDTGLACSIMNIDAEALWKDRNLFGQMLETYLFQELSRAASWQEDSIRMFHYRDKDQDEVDFVLECRGKVAGIEVKAASTVTPKDFRGLRKLQKASAAKFASGVVLYDGIRTLPFGEGLWAEPISKLWN